MDSDSKKLGTTSPLLLDTTDVKKSEQEPQDSEEGNDIRTRMRGLSESEPVGFLPHGSRASLSVLQGPAKGKTFVLEQPYNTIGRSPDNAVIIQDEFVSGRHAVIYFTKRLEWRLEDLNSRNGTLLNGSKVREFAIRNGDKILIGDHLMVFGFETEV